MQWRKLYRQKAINGTGVRCAYVYFTYISNFWQVRTTAPEYELALVSILKTGKFAHRNNLNLDDNY